MNSLPFISHHLFVAAVGNESRANGRPARQQPSSEETAVPATVIPLEVMGSHKPMPTGQARPLRTAFTPARG